jgi:macrolide transport system ATP-binding/permease protein
MNVMSVQGLSKSFGEREILKNIQFDIQKGEKIGLVGWNGAGKSTLMKMMIGELEPDKGAITFWPNDIRIGYLPQSLKTVPIFEQEWRESGNPLLQISSELGLRIGSDFEGEKLEHLSGGEQLKLALTRIWAKQPEFLVLDEPTNHLDMQGLGWLINEISAYPGSAIIISHDRYFLDQTVTSIFEIEDGELTVYKGNYSDYRAEKDRRRNHQARSYEKQQQKIKMIEQQVATLKQWSQKAHREAGKGGSLSENRQMGLREFERAKAKKKDKQLKSKLKRLELELSKNQVEKPKEEFAVDFQFEASEKRGKRILEAKGLSKQFGEQCLFEKSHFYLKHGEKAGLMGPNGAGKTTFIKMLLGEEPVTKGSLWKSDSLDIAYLSQDMGDLPLEKNVLDYFDLENWEQLTKVRTICANIGLNDDILTHPIGELSNGEQTRMKLVKMMIEDHDMLILDEPTNHLDLPSREQLEETLKEYSGTILLVTHDRYMLEKLCDKLLVIENKKICRVEMGLRELEERQSARKQPDKKVQEEEIALRDLKISQLLGEISMQKPGTEEYQRLDRELQSLMKKRLL